MFLFAFRFCVTMLDIPPNNSITKQVWAGPKSSTKTRNTVYTLLSPLKPSFPNGIHSWYIPSKRSNIPNAFETPKKDFAPYV